MPSGTSERGAHMARSSSLCEARCLARQPTRRSTGTKRVRQSGYERARASTVRALKPPSFHRKGARACPRVDVRPYLSFPRNEGVPGSNPGVGF
jgi:hypothetical protein